ncbi:nuclear transport factor 2 family protein [Shimia abyssi]|uniref:SnoaL-like protein n=1 Tax=Shimia abyssi TaxID=1662395 RepID=A0A2P8FKG7_9RHOB|nr:nuclear transport factor 2 family protein [Shimia abyssi]PSL22211.1 SnoaL-like protein [Shimia abyssi]
MSEHITAFFAAWGETDADKRAATLANCVSPDISYLDPRTPEPITGLAALNDYVAMYSQMAPGATARVANLSETGPMARATVEFAMSDGMKQNGQYFVETDDQSRPTRMVGFVGMGEPE